MAIGLRIVSFKGNQNTWQHKYNDSGLNINIHTEIENFIYLRNFIFFNTENQNKSKKNKTTTLLC